MYEWYNNKKQRRYRQVTSKIDACIFSGKGKLLKYFERKYSPSSLVSYCDMRYFYGNSYVSLGFELSSDTNPGCFYFKGMKRVKTFNEEKTELDNILDNNCRIIYDCGQRVFKKYYTHKKVTWKNLLDF